MKSFITHGEPIANWSNADEETGHGVTCITCGAVDQIEANDFPSFGGTTEGYEKCLACGVTYSYANISAIL